MCALRLHDKDVARLRFPIFDENRDKSLVRFVVIHLNATFASSKGNAAIGIAVCMKRLFTLNKLI